MSTIIRHSLGTSNEDDPKRHVTRGLWGFSAFRCQLPYSEDAPYELGLSRENRPSDTDSVLSRSFTAQPRATSEICKLHVPFPMLCETVFPFFFLGISSQEATGASAEAFQNGRRGSRNAAMGRTATREAGHPDRVWLATNKRARIRKPVRWTHHSPEPATWLEIRDSSCF